MAGDPPADDLTIHQLAGRAGMTVRNVRAHQSRGLLPPPTRRGRFAYYGPEHVRTLARIRELQAEGYNLAAIARLLDDDPPQQQAAMHQLLLAPLLDGDEVVLTWPEMAAMFGVKPSRRRLKMALETELIRDLGDGRYVAPSRQLIDAAQQLVGQGMSILDVYDMQVEMSRVTRNIAQRFVEACLRCALEPFGNDVPAERGDEVRERFERLRTFTTVVLAATFSVNVRRATESVVAQRSTSP